MELSQLAEADAAAMVAKILTDPEHLSLTLRKRKKTPLLRGFGATVAAAEDRDGGERSNGNGNNNNNNNKVTLLNF